MLAPGDGPTLARTYSEGTASSTPISTVDQDPTKTEEGLRIPKITRSNSNEEVIPDKTAARGENEPSVEGPGTVLTRPLIGAVFVAVCLQFLVGFNIGVMVRFSIHCV